MIRTLTAIGFCCVGLLPLAYADELKSNQAGETSGEDLDLELEEMVVTAQQPDWRKPKDEQDWRPDRFELSEQESQKRMEWLPEYSKDERDNYDQVRDRMNEEPDFQLFKWRF